MRAFKPVEIADVCLPFEAAEWLCFGKLPEMLPDEDAEEARMHFDALTSGDYFTFDRHIPREEEFKALNVQVDYPAYLDAVYGGWPSTIDELCNGNEEDRWRTRIFGPPHIRQFREVEMMDQIRAQLRPHVDRAELSVLLALIDGRLAATGFVVPPGWYEDDGGWYRIEDPSPEDVRDLADIIEPGPIPATAWRNEPDALRVGTSERNLPGFIGAWISTRQLLEVFPTPFVQGRPLSGRCFGSTLIVEGGESTLPKPPVSRRGRPNKGDGLVERAVLNEFQRRQDAGTLPAKAEAVLQECMDWSAAILGQEIARSTAQRYLRPLFSAQ